MNRQIIKINGETVVTTDTSVALLALLNGTDQFVIIQQWQGEGIATIPYVLNVQTVDTIIEVDA